MQLQTILLCGVRKFPKFVSLIIDIDQFSYLCNVIVFIDLSMALSDFNELFFLDNCSVGNIIVILDNI